MNFRHYNFELWAEGKRILHNMDLADALSAFLHLCFTFNLKYPQVVENKRMKYYQQLGKALGMKNVRAK